MVSNQRPNMMAPAAQAAAQAGSPAKGILQRKRPVTDSSIDKFKKRSRSDNNYDGHMSMSKTEILSLETAILESKKNYNDISTLIRIARKLDKHQDGEIVEEGSQNQETAFLSIVSLCRVFIRLLASGALLRVKNMAHKDIVVVHWLRDRLIDYHQILLLLLRHDGLATSGLTLSMRLLQAEGQYSQNDTVGNEFPNLIFKQIVAALCQRTVDQAVRQEFVDKFVNRFVDVRFYTFKAVYDIVNEQVSTSSSQLLSFEPLFDLLSSVKGVPRSAEDFENFYIEPPQNKKGHELSSVSKHKKQAQRAWLAVMTLEMDLDQRKRLLAAMSEVVAPWFTKPELLMDFLTDSYNTGGSMSVLALSGVFYLIRERNLDYPAFYNKLYSLLDVDMLHSRHRSRFFRLLDTFLASSHLPVALVASFIKRLARLSLNAPPSAIVTIIPWMYNLFKKHPICTFMVHRIPRTGEERDKLAKEGLEDPFQSDEVDPMKTGAVESCIWEIVQLQSHYHPNVATLAKIVSEQFTKQFYCMEDFLDHSYASLLEAEMAKNVKKPPVVEFQIPSKIFLLQEPSSGLGNNLLVKTWDFNQV